MNSHEKSALEKRAYRKRRVVRGLYALQRIITYNIRCESGRAVAISAKIYVTFCKSRLETVPTGKKVRGLELRRKDAGDRPPRYGPRATWTLSNLMGI